MVEIGFSLNQTDLSTNVISNIKSYKHEYNLISGFYCSNYEHSVQLEGNYNKELILNETFSIDNQDIIIKYHNINQQNITGGIYINNSLENLYDNYYLLERYVCWTNTILNKKYEYTFKYVITV